MYVCLFHKYVFTDLIVTVFDCLYPLFLQRLAELMEEHKEELATIESLDSGAVYTLALKTHIGMSIDTMRYFAGWADKIQVKLKENSVPNFFLNQENYKYTVCPVLCIRVYEIHGPNQVRKFFLFQDYRFPDHPKAKIKSSLVEHNPASVSTSRKLMCHKKS